MNVKNIGFVFITLLIVSFNLTNPCRSSSNNKNSLGELFQDENDESKQVKKLLSKINNPTNKDPNKVLNLTKYLRTVASGVFNNNLKEIQVVYNLYKNIIEEEDKGKLEAIKKRLNPLKKNKQIQKKTGKTKEIFKNF